ncbi:MAG: 3-phosphoserine/phosphohydroxythreonine transaminase [Paludibacteraceae bacterium]|nr:3-phosphoserine/phosphohydroxythreonine transaminase [Paludibacteraceae bacterium]
MKKYNFNAGPSILPQEVIKQTADAVMDFEGQGLSVLEISHRAKYFQPVMDEAEALMKELLNVPDGYRVLFLGGGASLQFCMVPFNLMEKKAAYLNTGVWSKKAMKEAQAFGEVVELAASTNSIPMDWEVPQDCDYLHITTNNTIFGTEISNDKLQEIYRKKGKVRLVADMSSDILSRPVDVSQFDLIYGGAQKNLAPAGVTFVIVKEECLGHVTRHIPTMLDYRTHTENGSMFNTPPVLPVYTAMLTLRWLKKNGGVQWINARNQQKADLLYNCIDNSKIFMPTITDREDRSRMNICFVPKPEYESLFDEFFQFATQRGMVGVKGHRLVGGFRASCYNAMDVEGVQALVDCIHDFEKLH